MKCWATPAASRTAIQTGFIQRPHAVSSMSADVAVRTMMKTPTPAPNAAAPPPMR